MEHDTPYWRYDLERLFAPESLLPSQMRSKSKLWKLPQVHLMAAVLTEALETLCKTRGKMDRRSRRLYDETKEWICEENAEWLYSFESICHVLGFHVEQTRKQVLRSDFRLEARTIHAPGGTNGFRYEYQSAER